MAQPYNAITVGSILGATFATLKANSVPVVLFLAVFIGGGSLADYLATLEGSEFGLAGGGLQMVVGLGSIVGAYFLMKAMIVTGGGFRETGRHRFIFYVGQSILIALGIGLGFVLLVVPGLIVWARWSLAAPLLVGRGEGAIEAMGRSWELTRGHALNIFLAALPLILFLLLAVGVIATAASTGDEGIGSIVMEHLATNLYTVLSTAMSVGLLGLFEPGTSEIEDIFA